MTETDVLVIGSGPAGSMAAIYLARAGFSPVVLGGKALGGQIVYAHEVENFPGFAEPISGAELMEKMHRQLKRLGAKLVAAEAVKVELGKKPFQVISADGEVYSARALIAATGAKARWLGLESEKKFMGKGVSSCAVCDGFFFRGKEVCVVGGGDAAVSDALFLAKLAAKVTLIHRRDKLRAHAALSDAALKNGKINFLWDSVVEEILGEDSVSAIKTRNVKTGETSVISCQGVFPAIGHEPDTGLFKNQLELDSEGYIVADEMTHTSVEGVFAAGDAADKRYKQAITASASGCVAAFEAGIYLRSL